MRYEVYAYAADETDFDSLGLVGALDDASCEHEEIALGMSEVTLVHPIDDLGKWRALARGNILKCFVPVRTAPEIDEDGRIITSVETWSVKESSTKAERKVYSKKVDGKVIGKVKKGEAVKVVRKPADATRYKIKGGGISGWIEAVALSYQTVDVIGDSAEAMDAEMPPWEMREQLFRIYSEVRTDREVTVSARHISYDLLGNLTKYKNAQAVTAYTCVSKVLERCVIPHEFTAQCDVADTRVGVNYRMMNPISAFLDPEEGACVKWGLELIRDNYELTFLKHAGIDRGMSVEYGKNLLGVNCTVNGDAIVTRVIPVGQTEDGKELYLVDDIDGEIYVDAENIGDYPEPHVMKLECSDCQVSEDLTVNKARQRMREQALEVLEGAARFPAVSMSVEFVMLGDTEEYAEFRGMERLFLYDKCAVKVPRMGIDAKLDLVRLRVDCHTGRHIAAEMGAVQDIEAGIQGYQIDSIGGGKIVPGTIGGGQLMDDIIAARHVKANSIYTDALQAFSVVADKIAAGAIDAEKIAAGVITADKLVAGIIAAGSALIQAGAIGTAQIADGSITSAKIVSLNADVINAGTLSAERLLLIGEGGVIYELNAAASGLSAVQLTEEQYRSKLNGTVIVAKSITAEQIAAAAITANEIAAGAVTASKIDVADLFANQATIAAINAMDIRGNEYLRLMVGGTEIGGRNYILNSDVLRGENFAIVGGSGGGVYMDGSALVILYGVTASQSGAVLEIS